MCSIFRPKKTIDEPHSADLAARIELRKALIDFMTGAIRAYAFDDVNDGQRNSTDLALREISRILYLFHDDFIDHPISVSPEGWELLRRIAAFLSTDLDAATDRTNPAWPFASIEHWHANEPLADGLGLPDYEPAIHNLPMNPWWNRIPTLVGFAVLAVICVGVVVAVVRM